MILSGLLMLLLCDILFVFLVFICDYILVVIVVFICVFCLGVSGFIILDGFDLVVFLCIVF